jgi:hypothetical protein
MYQNNQNKNVNRFLLISSIIIIALLGVIVFLIVKINPPQENVSLQNQAEQILTDINDNNLSSEINNGLPVSLPTSEQITDIIDSSLVAENPTGQNSGITIDDISGVEMQPNTNEKIVVSRDETVSMLNSFVKTTLLSGEAVLYIPKNYAEYGETVDYVPIQNSMEESMIFVDDLKYSQSYLNDYVFIKDGQDLKFTSRNVAFLDSFRHKNKIYWFSLVRGTGGVGRLILSEPNFINQVTLPDFKDDLIISIEKNAANLTSYTVEVSNGNGLKATNMKYNIDPSQIIDDKNSALVK